GGAPAAPKAGPSRSRADVDELAFLRSVTEDEGIGPSPKRASGAQFQPAVPEAPLTPTPAPAPEEGEDLEGEKTLKCRECGTMNLPTEWYCEECGAELAAL
ncbi:MAG TPA: hypothetical protein VNI61_00360, partial [Gemmatimonadales bacterium]|nr:hypothetical protein [Gemmatimonadales bacterium]